MNEIKPIKSQKPRIKFKKNKKLRKYVLFTFERRI